MINASLNGLRTNLANNYSRWVWSAVALNSADAFLTCFALMSGVSEFNPLIAAIIKLGVVAFLFTKLVVVNATIWWISRAGKEYETTKWFLATVVAIYGGVFLYHLVNQCLLLISTISA